jgi:hypothetical protein
MKKNVLLSAGFALAGMAFASCNDTDSRQQNGTDSRFLITVPATAVDATRTLYDGDKGRTIWEEGDQLQVITYCNDPATNQYSPSDEGFQLFSMAGDFDAEYAEFSGYAVKVPAESGTFTHNLHAFYPAAAMTSVELQEVTLPSEQRPTLESFDGDAAFMYSAPLPIEISDDTAGEVAPFRFMHINGFLKLSLGTLPEGMENETIESVVMTGEDGSALSGRFKFEIDSASGGEAYTMSEVAPLNSITLDYSGADLAISQNTDLWFVTTPGVYNNVIFTITTSSGKRINYAPREGLEIKAGVITPATLNFRDGDTVSAEQEYTITIVPTDFPLTSISSRQSGKINLSAEEENTQSVDIWYSKLSRSTSAANWYIKFDGINDNTTPEYANIYNKDAFGSKIISITIEAVGASYGKIAFGTAPEAGAFEAYQSGTVSGTTFTPINKEVDYRFFSIRGNGYQIKNMTIKYAVEAK